MEEYHLLMRQGRKIKIIKKLLTRSQITKLEKCTSGCFLAPIVVTVKKYDTITGIRYKLNKQATFKNKHQMPNVDESKFGVSQIITEMKVGALNFTVFN